MPYFGKISKQRLYTCRQPLILLFETVVQHWDCAVLCGHRTMEEQNALPREVSKVRWPNSAHNKLPSIAVDVVPWRCWGLDRPNVVWPDYRTKTYSKDLAEWYYFSGFVLGVAAQMGIKIRHGADWNMNRRVNDQTFDDLPHFELRE